MGGDLVKVRMLSFDIRSFDLSFSSVFMSRFTGLLASLLFSPLSVVWWLLIGRPSQFATVIAAMLGFWTLSSLIVMLLFVRQGRMLLLRLFPRRWKRAKEKWSALVNTLGLYASHLDLVVRAIVLSLLCQLLSIILVAYCLSLAIQASIPFIYFVLFIPIINLMTMLPISLNGLGVREGAYVLFFTLVGQPASLAVSISLLTYVLVLGISLVGGVLFLLGIKGDGRNRKIDERDIRCTRG
jgi:hypothetical protein